jgi:hypothetical protein
MVSGRDENTLFIQRKVAPRLREIGGGRISSAVVMIGVIATSLDRTARKPSGATTQERRASPVHPS